VNGDGGDITGIKRWARRRLAAGRCRSGEVMVDCQESRLGR